MYQKVMSLWHQLHLNMKSVVSWHYLLKDVGTVSGWTLDVVRRLPGSGSDGCFLLLRQLNSSALCRQVRSQSPSERQRVLDHLETQLADFLLDSRDSVLFTPAERQEVEEEVEQAQRHCRDLLLNMESGKTVRRLGREPEGPPVTPVPSLFVSSGEGRVGVPVLPVGAAGHHAPSGRGRAEAGEED